MNSIVLIVDKNCKWDPKDVLKESERSENEFNKFIYSEGEGWISSFEEPELINDFDAEELLKVANIISNPKFYLIEWKGDEILQKFINDIPGNILAIIDNDHGGVYRAIDLIGRPVSEWLRISSDD